jgi:probable phosphoglycerate mutase
VTRLVLVRHGESNVSVRRVIGGWRTCDGLSPLGRLQAERLRDRLASTGELTPDVLVASQYQRAIETGEIVAEAFPGMELLQDPGFGEHDPGPECDGISYADFVERYSPGEEAWADEDPFATTFPGGETIAAFHFRVGSAVRRLLDEHPDRTIVVFCHGGVVDAVLRQALRTPGMGGFQIHTLNTSITEFELVRRNLWRLVRYNDAAHLAGLPSHTEGAG